MIVHAMFYILYSCRCVYFGVRSIVGTRKWNMSEDNMTGILLQDIKYLRRIFFQEGNTVISGKVHRSSPINM